MNRHTPKEVLPTGDYIDDEGDIHPQTDSLDFDDANELLEDRDGVAVDIGVRAVNLLYAVDSYSKASMLKGLLRANNQKSRAKVRELGGEEAVRSLIKRSTESGRQALRAGTGIDAMLANPDMILDEDGFPYNAQVAEDDLVAAQYHFRNEYTAEGVRSMENATAVEKLQKSKDIERKREHFRRTLAKQALLRKTQP